MDVTVQILEISIFHSVHNLNFTRYFTYIFRYRRLIPKYLSNYFLNDRYLFELKLNTRKLFKNNHVINVIKIKISNIIIFRNVSHSHRNASPFRKDSFRGSDLFSNYLHLSPPREKHVNQSLSPPPHTR